MGTKEGRGSPKSRDQILLSMQFWEITSELPGWIRSRGEQRQREVSGMLLWKLGRKGPCWMRRGMENLPLELWKMSSDFKVHNERPYVAKTLLTRQVRAPDFWDQVLHWAWESSLILCSESTNLGRPGSWVWPFNGFFTHHCLVNCTICLSHLTSSVLWLKQF